MISDKINVQQLLSLLQQKNISQVVLSPGSRNAPLVNSFTANNHFHCINVLDERSAGFVALGIAQIKQQPVALVCTSGSALMNYGPAICEAFYRRIPLLILSADRPACWIDQGDGQAIRQPSAFANHVVAETTVSDTVLHQDQQWHLCAELNRVLNAAISQQAPVHINLPMAEPLYGMTTADKLQPARNVTQFAPAQSLTQEQVEQLAAIWQQSDNRLVVVGQQAANKALTPWLEKLIGSGAAVVVSEAQSNQPHGLACSIEDLLSHKQGSRAKLDLLITCGGNILSKSLKKWLTRHPAQHWHFSPQAVPLDSFASLSHLIPMELATAMPSLYPALDLTPSPLVAQWCSLAESIAQAKAEIIPQLPYADLALFGQLDQFLSQGPLLSELIGQKLVLHLGNSTPVRFAQYFPFAFDYPCYANRGVSGIDGCLSTAVGSALAEPEKLHLLICGDLSFSYDSNGLLNPDLPANLRVIIINNGGGQIFRLIPGPGQSPAFSQHFETRQQVAFKPLLAAYGVEYLRADKQQELQQALASLFDPDKSMTALEVVTQASACATSFNQYKQAISAI